MMGHAEAERACVKVSGDSVHFNRSCLKKAVPKGTGRGQWTEAARNQARKIWK
jgi:hypothetical protein